MECFAEIVF